MIPPIPPNKSHPEVISNSSVDLYWIGSRKKALSIFEVNFLLCLPPVQKDCPLGIIAREQNHIYEETYLI